MAHQSAPLHPPIHRGYDWAHLGLCLHILCESLRAYPVQTPSLEGLGAVVLAGAVLETAGQTFGAGDVWALAQDSGHLDPSAAQALNALGSDAVITNTAGLIVFGIAAGLSILRSGRLPGWLGWMAIAMAVVVTPVEPLSFIALVIWMVILSLLIWRRGGKPAQDSVRPPYQGWPRWSLGAAAAADRRPRTS